MLTRLLPDKPLVVRVYGDSISMPRCSEGVMVEDTWPSLLEDHLREVGWKSPRVLNRSLGGATVREIKSLFDRDAFYFKSQPGVVVFRFGIVDCTPRPIPMWLRDIVSKNPLNLGQPIISFLHRHRAAMIKRKFFQNTDADSFSKMYRQMVQAAVSNGNWCVCMGIGPVSPMMEDRSPGLLREMTRYNTFIESHAAEFCCLYAPFEDVFSGDGKSVLLSDGHHNNKDGNESAARYMAQAITARYNR